MVSLQWLLTLLNISMSKKKKKQWKGRIRIALKIRGDRSCFYTPQIWNEHLMMWEDGYEFASVKEARINADEIFAKMIIKTTIVVK